MRDWISNPEADYVWAAYAGVALALIGLILVSRYEKHKRMREWRHVSRARVENSDEDGIQ